MYSYEIPCFIFKNSQNVIKEKIVKMPRYKN